MANSNPFNDERAGARIVLGALGEYALGALILAGVGFFFYWYIWPWLTGGV